MVLCSVSSLKKVCIPEGINHKLQARTEDISDKQITF